ncbi:MAG: OmpA family protein [Bryobacteraceae bacterium]|jgi:outer membrane protein OmpA-like peptidoglycan-associated protein
MKRSAIIAGLMAGALVSAQVPNPTQNAPQNVPLTIEPTPIFRVEVVDRTTQAVNYLHRGGSTRIDFQGTPLMPIAKGSAKVESERGVIHVSAEFKDLDQPSRYGPEYLTYVLWAISPDGRPVNLGELTLDHYGAGSNSKIETTSDIQTFGMIVTAEPYYAVTQPSDVVVLENIVRPDTRGVIESVNAKYELLPRGMYTMEGKVPGFVPVIVGKKDPFELYEAENAVQLARVAGAEKYAPDSFQKADAALRQALTYQNQKPGQKPVITMAREAAVRAEDARVVALRREQAEQQENERQAGIARENAAKERAESERVKAREEANLRAQAEADRMLAERSKAEALEAARQAQMQKQEADAARYAADAARQAALAQQQQLAAETERARMAAAESDRLRQQAEQNQAQLRQQLLDQFNSILQTRDTARGLIVNMSDVLFDTGKYALRPGAREKLAKVSGIIMSHPGLRIQVEGHTDSVGGDEYNMRLSENRADAVRGYLVEQGVQPGNVTAQGFGKTLPVADNTTAAGRQMNRRVELVVSGDIIGTSITTARTSGSSQ